MMDEQIDLGTSTQLDQMAVQRLRDVCAQVEDYDNRQAVVIVPVRGRRYDIVLTAGDLRRLLQVCEKVTHDSE